MVAQIAYINADMYVRMSAKISTFSIKTRKNANSGDCIKILKIKRHKYNKEYIAYKLKYNSNPLISLVRENVPRMSRACPHVRELSSHISHFSPNSGTSRTLSGDINGGAHA